ncbi:ABC transporter permease [candidate division KSB1 bacterium]|nr:ABC transporter permease [candidate division KSB1 bacterium]
MRQIFYMLKKEFAQIFRTREMLVVIFGVPMIQMIILGFTITNEVKNVSLLIVDQDNSQVSRDIARAFSNTDRFDVFDYDTDIQNVKEAIHNWKVQAALVIPSNFGRDLLRNLKPEIQILVDGVDGNTAGVAMSYAQGILTDFAQSHLQNPSKIKLLKNSHIVQIEDRMWFNPNLDNAQYMIPGIVVILITVISMMLSAINLVREKEIGTLEQLMVTPLKRYQLLVGKLLPFLILTFIEMGIVMTAANFIFSVKVSGSFLLLAGMASLFLFTTLGLGILISTISSTQQQAMFISWFFMVFMMLMSGFFIPIENMPIVLQKITYLNPLRYFMFIIRDIIQKGSPLQYLLVDAVPMTVYGLTIFIIAILNFHKRIA